MTDIGATPANDDLLPTLRMMKAAPALLHSCRSLLAVLEEAGITCRFERSGGCERAGAEPKCEMCTAHAAINEAVER